MVFTIRRSSCLQPWSSLSMNSSTCFSCNENDCLQRSPWLNTNRFPLKGLGTYRMSASWKQGTRSTDTNFSSDPFLKMSTWTAGPWWRTFRCTSENCDLELNLFTARQTRLWVQRSRRILGSIWLSGLKYLWNIELFALRRTYPGTSDSMTSISEPGVPSTTIISTSSAASVFSLS